MKNYIIAGVTEAGLAAGVFNGWTGTEDGRQGCTLTDSTSGALANTGKVVVLKSGVA